MKTFILSCWVAAFAWKLAAFESRTWTSSDGRTVEAALVEYDLDAETVTFRTNANRVYTLAFTHISEEDRKWLEEHDRRRKVELARAGTRQTFVVKGKHESRYHVYYPKSYDPDQPAPVLILFSPGGKAEGMLKNVEAGCDELGWIAVAMDHFKNGGDSEELHERFGEMFPHVMETLGPDRDAMYLGGMSGGALRAYSYTGNFEGPWRGVLAYGGWMGGDDLVDTARNLRVAIVNGDKDANANAWLDNDTKVLRRRKCEVKIFSFSGGHVMGGPEVTADAMRWLHSDEKD